MSTPSPRPVDGGRAPGPKPRNEACPRILQCINVAIAEGWPSWSCAACPFFDDAAPAATRATLAPEKPVNARERTTRRGNMTDETSSATEIAAALKIRPWQVYEAAKKLGLAMKDRSATDHKRLLDALQNGLPKASKARHGSKASKRSSRASKRSSTRPSSPVQGPTRELRGYLVRPDGMIVAPDAESAIALARALTGDC